MIIQSSNFCLKLEEILKGEAIPNELSETEKKVIDIVKKWQDPEVLFEHQTSGSTGTPKSIVVRKEKIIHSVEATMNFLDVKREFKNTLLCLNPSFIGGAMVVYRALHRNLDLFILEPDAKPTPDFSIPRIDLVSMVPLQFQKLSDKEKSRFRVILIGGAPMPAQEERSSAACFATFGMTETVSHFALRNIQSPYFETIGDTAIKVESDGSLSINGVLTNYKWLNTNDLVEIVAPNKFRWLGRKDFVINSGGLKFNPETIESKIQSRLQTECLILYLPDRELNQRLVLVTEEDERPLDFSFLPRYEQPKETVFNFQIPRTASGKADRRKAQKLLIEQQS